jgi:hypothetical protein
MKVAMEATIANKTVAEIASSHRVHPTQVSQCKKQMQVAAPEISGGKRPQSEASEALVSQLYE